MLKDLADPVLNTVAGPQTKNHIALVNIRLAGYLDNATSLECRFKDKKYPANVGVGRFTLGLGGCNDNIKIFGFSSNVIKEEKKYPAINPQGEAAK
ncbi:hypothetical protein H1S01_18910 [Heliobacterium chlorum]|uniref:Uncharacterized protein n=1 Tax=Heliobacterium chlorum TaxID=2698 RepID=A0ABR7T6Y8_HELCL|nr:hypothetical protein [Heliobacterium chlorum]MBC9786529.1 hypothetical protein [Heliobacterium chlorum]